jgi:hypothetical protein
MTPLRDANERRERIHPAHASACATAQFNFGLCIRRLKNELELAMLLVSAAARDMRKDTIRNLGHLDGGVLRSKVYGHLCADPCRSQAARINFGAAKLRVLEWVNCGVFPAPQRAKTSRGAGFVIHSTRPPAVERISKLAFTQRSRHHSSVTDLRTHTNLHLARQ